MSIDFRLIKGLFDCASCLGRGTCDEETRLNGLRLCDKQIDAGTCRDYGRDPAYKRKEKTDQRSDASH